MKTLIATAALLGLTREWAASLANDGVRVNAVLPAEAMTPMYRAELDRLPDPAAALAAIEKRIPLGRFVQPDEVARTVCFLLGDDAAMVNGACLEVDGGFSAG